MKIKPEQEAACRHSLDELISAQTGRSAFDSQTFKAFARSLSAGERRKLRRQIIQYEKNCSLSCTQMRTALTAAGLFGLKGVGQILWRGAAGGVAVAGVVNTVAPGLYYVGLSSLASVIYQVPVIGGFFTKIGLITVSLITPPQAAQSLILVVGGVIGIFAYALFIFIRWLIRKLILSHSAD